MEESGQKGVCVCVSHDLYYMVVEMYVACNGFLVGFCVLLGLHFSTIVLSISVNMSDF